jgi:hypothetical protein
MGAGDDHKVEEAAVAGSDVSIPFGWLIVGVGRQNGIVIPSPLSTSAAAHHRHAAPASCGFTLH